MRIIEIEALENGAHRNQKTSINVKIPEGWAIIPDDIEIPETFPFVHVYISGGEVAEMTPGVVPPPEPTPEPEPSAEDIINALLGVSE